MEKITLDIVELIEANPITKLTDAYNNKLLTKIKNNFDNEEQQMFIASFYGYLHYDVKKDFVIDLDKVWKWLGFNQKYAAKRSIEKFLTINVDYIIFTSDISLLTNGEQKNEGRGGHNKEIIMLTIKAFKSFCLKAGTKKANQIHDYYLKLEEILHEVLEEESVEMKQQLKQKLQQIEQQEKLIQTQKELSVFEKEELLEKTLLEQFPVNVQCVYYGRIDNTNDKREKLIKFGQTNDLAERIKCHKKNFKNFRLLCAFKVQNKIQIENAIKRHSIMKNRLRSLLIPNNKEEETMYNFRELLALNDNFTIENVNHFVKDIITENEYNIENYNLLLDKYYKLESEMVEIEKEKKELLEENKNVKSKLQNYKPDITTDFKNNITTYCKNGFFLYAFECEKFKYKCSIVRIKNLEDLVKSLKTIDPNGELKYSVKVSHPFCEKIMNFLMRKFLTTLGNNYFDGSFENITQILDIVVKLENLLVDKSTDLEQLYSILSNNIQNITQTKEEVVPETPQVKKAMRSIDQINPKTNEVIQTFESIEAAGRSLGLTTGTAVGIALREKRICKGFLWRYSGISKEEQYAEQSVCKVCCNTGEKKYFSTIADAAKDIGISAPAMRQRILTKVHLNEHHWIFDKSANHYIS